MKHRDEAARRAAARARRPAPPRQECMWFGSLSPTTCPDEGAEHYDRGLFLCPGHYELALMDPADWPDHHI